MSSLAPSPETTVTAPAAEEQGLPAVPSGSSAYVTLLSLAARLPLTAGYPAARAIGRARHRRLPRSDWLVPEAARALGVDRALLERWARRSSELRACDELDALRFGRLRRGGLERLIRVEGLAHLDHALAAGRGAVLVSGHVDGRHLLFARLAELGYEPTVIGYSPGGWVGPSSIPLRVRERRVSVLQEEFGCRFSFMEPGNFGVAVKAANVLRRNGVVIMLVDLPHSRTAVDVDFFGGRTSFSVGPAQVSQATGAPLLDFYVHREDSRLQVAEIGEPFQVEGSPEQATRVCASRLEAAIRQHPPPPRKYFSRYPWRADVRPPRPAG